LSKWGFPGLVVFLAVFYRKFDKKMGKRNNDFFIFDSENVVEILFKNGIICFTENCWFSKKLTLIGAVF